MTDERPYLVSSVATSSRPVRGVAKPAVALLVGVALGLAVSASGGQEVASSSTAPASAEGQPSASGHSRQGAARALVASMRKYSLEALVSRDVAEATFQAIGTPAFVQSELLKWDRAAATAGGRLLARAASTGTALGQTAPLRYAVDSYDGDRAVVRAWSVTVLAGKGLAPSAQFSVDRGRLVWDGGGWRLDRLVQAREGPTPGALISELTHSSRSLVEALRGFQELDGAR